MPGRDNGPVQPHQLEFGIDLSWVDESRGGIVARYIEVESPLDQNRIGGDPPRPWGREPRYAWMLGPHGNLHIAGLASITTIRGAVGWEVVDLFIPWSNVRTLQEG
jgi:hypothetical protein